MRRTALPAGVDRPLTATGTARIASLLVLATAFVVVSETAVGRPVAPGRGAERILDAAFAGGYIPAAMRALERERDQLRRERDAFERFATAVKSISASGTGRGTACATLAKTVTSNGQELQEIRDRYRSLVMGVDHFERVYGEGLYENMSEELSENVASAVDNGNRFSPLLKQAIVRQTGRAVSRRESLERTIEAERDSLEDARNGIREIEADRPTEADPSARSLSHLFRSDRRLHRCERRYERLLEERQRHIQSERQPRSMTEDYFIQAYLYRSLEVDFPVLTTVLERYDRLRKRRRAIRQAIIYR